MKNVIGNNAMEICGKRKNSLSFENPKIQTLIKKIYYKVIDLKGLIPTSASLNNGKDETSNAHMYRLDQWMKESDSDVI